MLNDGVLRFSCTVGCNRPIEVSNASRECKGDRGLPSLVALERAAGTSHGT
jgi:hypothetical protein